MLIFRPLVDKNACLVYVAQTFARWHDGVSRPEYADYWCHTYGPLTAPETTAAQVLHEHLQKADGCAIIHQVITESEKLDKAVATAFTTLFERAERIYEDAKPALLRWADRLENHPPQWFERMNQGLDNFFGVFATHPLRVYLFPGPPKSTCGNGDMFVEKGATTLSCSGMPFDEVDGVFLILLHEAVHSVHQSQALDPLSAKVLESPEGQRILEMYRKSPAGRVLGGNMLSYIGELVIHSLVPYGALRKFCGLPSAQPHWDSVLEKAQSLLHLETTEWGDVYTAWVSAACAKMVPLGREYIVKQKPLDEAFVYAALETFEGIYLRWQQGLGRTNPSSGNQ